MKSKWLKSQLTPLDPAYLFDGVVPDIEKLLTTYKGVKYVSRDGDHYQYFGPHLCGYGLRIYKATKDECLYFHGQFKQGELVSGQKVHRKATEVTVFEGTWSSQGHFMGVKIQTREKERYFRDETVEFVHYVSDGKKVPLQSGTSFSGSRFIQKNFCKNQRGQLVFKNELKIKIQPAF